jgi:hypothetical protein
MIDLSFIPNINVSNLHVSNKRNRKINHRLALLLNFILIDREIKF